MVHLVIELRDELPLAFIGGGLKYLPAKVSRATTSTERLRYEPTDLLSASDARRAVSEPASERKVSWEKAAIDEVVRLSEGCPYFLQLYAFETWEIARRRGSFSRITTRDVASAIPEVERQLNVGLYLSRFDKLGPVQREYVFAMASLMTADLSKPRERVRSSDIAQVLGRTPQDCSPVRDGLIQSGLVHSPAHGDLEFSVPGFLAYVDRRREDKWYGFDNIDWLRARSER